MKDQYIQFIKELIADSDKKNTKTRVELLVKDSNLPEDDKEEIYNELDKEDTMELSDFVNQSKEVREFFDTLIEDALDEKLEDYKDKIEKLSDTVSELEDKIEEEIEDSAEEDEDSEEDKSDEDEEVEAEDADYKENLVEAIVDRKVALKDKDIDLEDIKGSVEDVKEDLEDKDISELEDLNSELRSEFKKTYMSNDIEDNLDNESYNKEGKGEKETQSKSKLGKFIG